MKTTHHSNGMLLIVFVALVTLMNQSANSQDSKHSCGPENIHSQSVNYGQAIDIDGNTYKTVIINDQIWFSENLKVTRFQNGEAIPNVSDSAAWAGLPGPGMCSYRNDSTYDCPYGKLYNFYVASDPRNPCPNGWRVPTMADLYKLIFFLDPNANAQQPGNTPNIAGGYLKSTGFAYWRTPNTNATNISGFSAIPNGGRNDAGKFSISNDAAASYWLSTLAGASPGKSMGFFLELAFPQELAVRNAYWANYGACIRCVTDRNSMNAEDTIDLKSEVQMTQTQDALCLQLQPTFLGTQYSIIDVNGRTMLEGLIQDNFVISIGDLPNGSYFLTFPRATLQSVQFVKK